MLTKLFLKFYFDKMKTLAISSLIVGFVLSIWFTLQMYFDGYINFSNKISLEEFSRVGSFIGGTVGLFFTLAGVFLLIETLNLQREEFTKNREIFTQQQFENKLFNLLNVQQQLLSAIEFKISINGKDHSLKGRGFFELVRTEIKKTYELLGKDFLDLNEKDFNLIEKLSLDPIFKEEQVNELYNDQTNGNKRIIKFLEGYNTISEFEKAKSAYKIIFNHYHQYLGHYFRHLFHILKFINQYEISETLKKVKKTLYQEEINFEMIINGEKIDNNKFKEYADIVQAQMSSSELFVLFFNGLCFPQTGDLIKHYNFLENLAVEDLIKESHKDLYEEEGKWFGMKKVVTFKSRKSL